MPKIPLNGAHDRQPHGRQVSLVLVGKGRPALTCHWHVDGDSISLLDALCLQPIGLHTAHYNLSHAV